MVVRRILLLALLLSSGLLQARNVRVSTEINSAAIGEGQPFEVFVKIVRDEDLEVDPNSFLLDGDPVEASLVNSSQQSSVTIVNGRRSEEHFVTETYRFYAEGREAGSYRLPVVTVEVGGEKYSSAPLSFQISAAGESRDFRLEAYVDGVTPLYPGQKARFVYRIYSKRVFDITSEDLPLLGAEGFRKVGEKKVRQFTRGDMRVWEITQEVQAVKPGYFRFSPSAIEAFAYQETFFGRKRYIQPRMRAEADSVILKVDEFPTGGQPRNFTGAVGEFTIRAKLLTPSSVHVGDKMELELRFSGTGEWETIRLPSLSGEPGFKGQFRLSDLPPVGELKNNDKVFVVELRPLSEEVERIPSIRFSSFDPVARKFLSMSTDPIEVEVAKGRALEKVEREPQPTPPAPVYEEPVVQPEEDWELVKPIAIYGNHRLKAKDLATERPNVWLVVLFGAALLLAQYLLRGLQIRRPQTPRKLSSMDYLSQARRSSGDRLALLEKALHQRAKEIGSSAAPELQAEVQELLNLVAEQRFAGITGTSSEALMGRVEGLCRKESS